MREGINCGQCRWCVSRKVTKGLEQELNRLKFPLHSVGWKCRRITFAILQRIKLI